MTDFNPRAYVRHDVRTGGDADADPFQSTCLREARPSTGLTPGPRSNFNPRAYVRHDQGGSGDLSWWFISIHVPT